MIRQGADILFQNADAAGLGIFQAVEENAGRGVLAFGSNADQSSIRPKVIMASAVIGVPEAFVQVARDTRDGHLSHDLYVEDLKGTAKVALNPRLESRIPAAAREAMDKARAEIIAGRLKMPPPP